MTLTILANQPYFHLQSYNMENPAWLSVLRNTTKKMQQSNVKPVKEKGLPECSALTSVKHAVATGELNVQSVNLARSVMVPVHGPLGFLVVQTVEDQRECYVHQLERVRFHVHSQALSNGLFHNIRLQIVVHLVVMNAVTLIQILENKVLFLTTQRENIRLKKNRIYRSVQNSKLSRLCAVF